MSKIYLEEFHFQARRDTAANWNTNNPVLCDGEFGIVTDSDNENWLKVGDGVTPWKQLPFKKGPTGAKGDKGDKGDTGATGAKGEQGNKGDKGDKGDRGDAFTYSDFTEEQLAGLKGEKGDKGDPGDVNTLQMNTACSNALRGSAFGSAVRMDDISPNEHTLRVKVSSKNLIPYPYAVQGSTINGITYTNNSDGSVTAVGTAIDGSIYAPYTTTANFEIEPGTYTFSDDLASTSALTYWSEVRGYKDDTIIVRSYDTDRTFTITEKTKLRMNLRVVKGQTVDITFKPQLVKGTATTPFSSYVNDLSTVTVTRCGKNLIQFPYIPLTAEKTVAGITYTPLSDGGIKLNGTATAISSVVFYNNTSQGAVPITLKANLTYMASTGLSSDIGVYIRPFKPSGNSHVAITDVFTTRTITSTEDATVDQILVVVASGITVNNVVIYPQIELGSAATGYELYDGQTYTPAADGTVENVKSLCPTSTLTTDTSGVVISAEYNKDINKAFAELQQAIISLGGNV